MSQVQAELAANKSALPKKDHKITWLCEKASNAASQAQDAKADWSMEVSALKQELENTRLRAEVDKVSALDDLREEH